MPYSITTKDGITINNIPDDVAADSPVLKERVAKLRASGGGAVKPPAAPEPKIDPSAGGSTLKVGFTPGTTLDTGISMPESITRFLAGAGESFDRLGNIGRSKEEIAVREKLNQPLMDTTAGKVGQVTGDIAKGIAASGGVGAIPGLAARGAGLGAGLAREALAGGLIGGVEAGPEDAGWGAGTGAVMGAGGEMLGRGAGRLIAPLKPKLEAAGLFRSKAVPAGSAGERALLDADTAAIARKLGADAAEAVPVSGQLPGTQGEGIRRLEIAMRNLPVVGKGMKAKDAALRDAYTRQLFGEAGADIGPNAVGPQAFRAMDAGLGAREADLLAQTGGAFDNKTLADRLLATSNDYIPGASAAERKAAEEAAARAAASGATLPAAVDAAQGAQGAALAGRAAAAGEDAGLAAEVESLRQAAIAARQAGGRDSDAYINATRAYNEARAALRQVAPTERMAAGFERGAERAGAGAAGALGKANEAEALAAKLGQQTGWADFDQLVADAARAKAPDELLALNRRANDLFGSVREGQDAAKAAKLTALRGFKQNVFDTLDDALPADAKGGFNKLSKQQGMASTLREVRDTAGQTEMSPAAVSKNMERVFGPKSAAAETMEPQQLAGALERRAADAFAAGPEQYKALMAGTLMGEGAFSMLKNAKALVGSPLAAMLLSSEAGRKFLVNSSKGKGAEAAELARMLLAGSATGQADVPGLF